ncbi:MAG: pilus assembly protein [Chloroflexi bacterium AL-W]|nr:pilus assembly protein [Chloroflexi bacterium AL-N1]NOK65739.1 pilus assembly protein [Chloroflexi bacterium AL-N10]NOK74320.1 pilus assembly protein [Chloroflexi bacterium AL-N5]NOK80772.1 pilus assembly protein [Chloroflexi bacterium AL-W]NOK88578.1 pilus assembly protein [Chloroflexi bacterium AL-N15]
MRRRSQGQSLVEMALLLPLLLLLFFGIIDLGYYIYGYATIYQSARNGSEVAAQLPPFSTRIGGAIPDTTDHCVNTIIEAVKEDTVLFSLDASNVVISYPSNQRLLGEPIEVSVNYDIEPLTPLWSFVTFGSDGTMSVSATSRRSIEALGNNPAARNFIVCEP